MSTKTQILDIAKANRLPAEPTEGFIFRRGGDYPEEREFMILEDTENICRFAYDTTDTTRSR